MAPASGTRIGPDEVTGTLGAGGMGEVYRARDARLARDVALKVLPDSFAEDPERLARFQREAQVLAALTHPNIGAIYGLEEQTDVVSGVSRTIRALVLELVEGDTLAERLARGAIPVDEALAIAKQIAESMDSCTSTFRKPAIETSFIASRGGRVLCLASVVNSVWLSAGRPRSMSATM